MRCQQCWDHRCVKDDCHCKCHEEYDKELAKNAKKFGEILKEEQKAHDYLLKRPFKKTEKTDA